MVCEGFVPARYNSGGYSGYSHWGSVSVRVLSAATWPRGRCGPATRAPECNRQFCAAKCGRQRSRPAWRRHRSARATALCGCGGTGGMTCTGLRRLGRLQWRRLALGAGLAEPVRAHLCNHQQSDTHKSDRYPSASSAPLTCVAKSTYPSTHIHTLPEYACEYSAYPSARSAHLTRVGTPSTPWCYPHRARM